jgi:hypothetical protein
MENMRIKISIFAVNTEIFNCLGTLFAKQLKMDISNGSMNNGRIVDSLIT